MDNTYKMAWARSLVEHSESNPKQKEIHFDELSPLIFKYYWDQTIFFNLEQSPNTNNPPEILQIVRNKIAEYQNSHDSKQPINFIKVEDKVDFNPREISSVLKKDVSKRFKKVGGNEYFIYNLDRKNRKLSLYHPELLKEYSDLLYPIINYRWTQKLEAVNNSP